MVSSLIGSLILTISGFFFVGPGHSYAVLLPEGTQLVQIDTLTDGIFNHTFIGMDKVNNLEYSMSFSVVGGKTYNLLDSNAVYTYEKDCNCEVIEAKKVEFSNFRGVQYSIIKEVDDNKLEGEVYVSELKNGKSINVISLVLPNQRQYIDPSLHPILNTLVLNF